MASFVFARPPVGKSRIFLSKTGKTRTELFEASGGPWKLGDNLGLALGRQIYDRPIRAALLKADTLTVALGRPNREVAVTTRPSTSHDFASP